MEWHAGQVIAGKYRLLRPLGEGGQAVVWDAEQIGVGGFAKEVALKLVPPHSDNPEETRRRLLQEARFIAKIRHPHIVEIYDVGDIQGLVYLVMEKIQGSNFETLLRSSKERLGLPPPWPLAIRLLADLCKGLHRAHHQTDAQGQPFSLIHRDLKLENLLINHDGYVKIIDFGIARGGDLAHITSSDILKGTPAFMSPEQILSQPIDPRSDLFSLGVVAYTLTTGHLPFFGGHIFSLMIDIVSKPPPPPTSFNPTLPKDLESILLRLLEKKPDDRFSSAREAQQAFERLLQKGGYLLGTEDVAQFISDLRDAPQETLLRWYPPTEAGLPSETLPHSPAWSEEPFADDLRTSDTTEKNQKAKASAPFAGNSASDICHVDHDFALLFEKLKPLLITLHKNPKPLSLPPSSALSDVESWISQLASSLQPPLSPSPLLASSPSFPPSHDETLRPPTLQKKRPKKSEDDFFSDLDAPSEKPQNIDVLAPLYQPDEPLSLSDPSSFRPFDTLPPSPPPFFSPSTPHPTPSPLQTIAVLDTVQESLPPSFSPLQTVQESLPPSFSPSLPSSSRLTLDPLEDYVPTLRTPLSTPAISLPPPPSAAPSALPSEPIRNLRATDSSGRHSAIPVASPSPLHRLPRLASPSPPTPSASTPFQGLEEDTHLDISKPLRPPPPSPRSKPYLLAALFLLLLFLGSLLLFLGYLRFSP